MDRGQHSASEVTFARINPGRPQRLPEQATVADTRVCDEV